MIHTRDSLWVNVPREWWEQDLDQTHSISHTTDGNWTLKLSTLIYDSKSEAESRCKSTEVTVTLEEREHREWEWDRSTLLCEFGLWD